MEPKERSLGDYLDDLKDKETFLDFIWALIEDREAATEKDGSNALHGASTNGWENTTIESFFDAALACATAVPGRLPEEASWQEFASFLYMGKIYE